MKLNELPKTIAEEEEELKRLKIIVDQGKSLPHTYEPRDPPEEEKKEVVVVKKHDDEEQKRKKREYMREWYRKKQGKTTEPKSEKKETKAPVSKQDNVQVNPVAGICGTLREDLTEMRKIATELNEKINEGKKAEFELIKLSGKLEELDSVLSYLENFKA